jgi:hypothetical protein
MGTYTDIDKCLRCHQPHPHLPLNRYDEPNRWGATLIAMCPNRGWAILFIERQVATGPNTFKLELEQC